MNKLKLLTLLCAIATTILAAIANAAAYAPTTIWFTHQPKCPKSLQK